MVEKLIRDGQVAVLISPGFGAGWSTWAGDNAEAMLFDREIAEALLNKRPPKEIEALADQKFPDEYKGGLDQVCVEWLPVGTRFSINEYDGSESIITLKELTYEA